MSQHIKSKSRAIAVSETAEAAKKEHHQQHDTSKVESDDNEHHRHDGMAEMGIDHPSSSDEDSSTEKRKQIDAFIEKAGRAAAIGANPKRKATADFYEQERKCPDYGARRLVRRAAMQIESSSLEYFEFVLSLSDLQIEQYANL